MENGSQNLASETPKKIVGKNCFLCSFPLILQARIRVFGKSSVDIAHLTECAVQTDLNVFSSSDRSSAISATSGYFVLKKLKQICDPFRMR